ncbi:MAG: FlgD immunoglobulin-like domain containing protein [Candidatus Krumholzibacteriia bacterium]
MNIPSSLSVVIAVLVLGVGRLGAAEVPVLPDGYVILDSMTANTCLAVRVSVPPDQAVSGIRWFNGATEPGFDRVLVAGGSGLFPPALAEAVPVAEDIPGAQEDWSDLEFSEPVGSTTGSLFLIMKYPADYVPPEGGAPLGVGYRNVENRSDHFVTDDGSDWIKVSSRCQLMMEPVFCALTDTTLVKSMQPSEADEQDLPLPKVLALDVYPNPFNPQATIRLALPQDTACSLKVYDVRGRLVRDFRPGTLPAGFHEFVWRGRDDRDQPVGSGVYFARIMAGGKTLGRRMVLIK